MRCHDGRLLESLLEMHLISRRRNPSRAPGTSVVHSGACAAVSRESRGDVIHVRVSLLESDGRPEDQPGRSDVVAAFTARQLGADLAAAFGSKDVIILK